MTARNANPRSAYRAPSLQVEVDGRSAYAYTGGKAFDPSLPTVCFVHGAQNDHSVWILQSRYLAHHGYGVLAWDLPGHGRSAGPPLPDIESMAAWLLRASAATGAGPIVIVGHSMGSLIALEAAGSQPGRVRAIALVGTAFPMKVSDALLAAAASDEARAFDMINQWSFSGITHQRGNPGPGFSVFNQTRRLMERQPAGVLLNDFQACNRYASGLERAAAVACPALVVMGESDQMTPPRAARALQQAIAGSRTVPVARCGHAVMQEQPEALLTALRDFLGSLARV